MASGPGTRWFALSGVAFILVYAALLPFTSLHLFLGGIAYPLPALAGLAIAPTALRKSHGRQRAGWASVAAMLVTWTAAEGYYSFYALVLERDAPFPNAADPLYYAGYVALIAAAVLLANTGAALRDWRATVDGVTVSVVAGALIWQFIAEPAARGAGSSTAVAVALGYPLLDLALACSILIAYLGTRTAWPRSVQLLLLSITALFISDTLFGLTSGDTVAAASYLDIGWLAGYALMGLALLEASRETAGGQGQAREEGRFLALILPHVTVLPLMLAAFVLEVDGINTPVVNLAAMAAMGLLAVRQLMTLLDNRGMYRAARARSRELQRLATELEEQRERAMYSANHDPLTNLLNRRAWFAPEPETVPHAVIIFDVDHFKKINDTLGHPSGDEVLRQLATELGERFSAVGEVARLGGEEFGVKLLDPSCDPEQAATAMVEATLRRLVTIPGGQAIPVTVSAGVARWTGEPVASGEMLDLLYQEADAALYEAKEQGRGRAITHDARPGRMAA